jgi:biotin synthase
VFKDWFELSERRLAGGRLSRADARALLPVADAGLLEVVAAEGRLRRAHFGDWVKVNYLVNLKSGLCPEDCWYCSQRAGSAADVLKYSLLPADEAVRQGAAGIAAGASRVCLVASGRGPGARELDRAGAVAARLKAGHPGVEVCARPGILGDGQTGFALREIGSDSIPVNFLMPFDGTPLAGTWLLDPRHGLRILALPDRDQPPGSRRERVAARRRGAGTDTAPKA